MNYNFLAVLFCIGIFRLCLCQGNRTCDTEDFKFAYTECQNNTRWRVQVPKVPGFCSAKSVATPTKAKPCNFNCGPGQHLDINSLSCQACPAGSFSIGDGVRWDNWDTMPEGFTVVLTPFDRESDDCSSNGEASSEWNPFGHYLGGRISPNCQMSLTKKVTIAGQGSVTFTYQNSNDDTFFSFEVSGGQCSSSTGADIVDLLPVSRQGEVKSLTNSLKPGVNMLEWVILPSSITAKPSVNYPVRILSIEVRGLSETQYCQRCRPGYSSKAGSTNCTACAVNEFSADGSVCKACPAGQFAPAAAAACMVRPACTEADYFSSYSSCNNGQHQLQYTWLQPKFCNEQAANSVKLPPAKPLAPCGHRCSAGQTLATDSSTCQFCPAGTYAAAASSSTSCQTCPARTQPVKMFSVSRWLSLPPLITANCLPSDPSDLKCSGELAGWLLMANRIETKPMRLRAYRLLHVTLPGFVRHQSDASVFAIDFQIQCKSKCNLLMLRTLDESQELIRSWSETNNASRHHFKYIIRTNDQHKFTFVFDPLTPGNADSGIGNTLRIFSINATDVVGSGAVSCRVCPLGLEDDKCVQCPAGNYYSSSSSSCENCPNGTYVARRLANDISACSSCPSGLLPSKTADSCVADTQLQLGGRAYNLSTLAATSWIAVGGRRFSERGTQYHHLFNVSLTGEALCTANSSGKQQQQQPQPAFACRSTLVSSYAIKHTGTNTNTSSQAVTLLPVTLGNQLVNVTPTAASPRVASLLRAGGWPADPDGYDLHAFFTSDSSTKACAQGRTVVLTMRCSAAHSRPVVQLPPSCPDGTCDGCVFHLMLLSQLACPVCRLADFERVKGECVMGTQIVHLYPPKHCYLSGEQPAKQTTTISCPLVAKPVAILLMLALAMGAASLLVACYCCRRNRTLQYKYMQLAEAQEGSELPGVESCAVNEGDDEEDEDGGGGGGHGAVLSRLRHSLMPSGRSKGRRRKDKIEHLNLTEEMDDLNV